MHNDDWITVDEAAAILGVSRCAAQYRIKSGDLIPAWPPPEERIKGKPVYLSRAQCLAIGRRWHKPKFDSYQGPPPRDPDWITPAEAAELLGVPTNTFRYRADRDGVQPVTHQRGRGAEIYYSRQQIEGLREQWAAHAASLPARNDPDVIDIHEAARILGLKKRGVMARVQSDTLTAIPVHRPGARQPEKLLFSRAEVERSRDYVPPAECPPYDKNPSREAVIHFAGLFEGEGSVGIHWNRGSGQYLLRISVANTYRPKIDWIVETFGGSVVTWKPRPANHYPIHHWSTTTSTAYRILKLMLEAGPWLCVKRRQAELAVAFHEHLLAYNGHYRRSIDPDELAWREQQRARMLKLNERGNFIPEEKSPF